MKDEVSHSIIILEHSIDHKTTDGTPAQMDHWIKTLKEHGGFSPILQDMDALKQAITNLNGEEIHSLLEKLGHETIKASEKATPHEMDLVKKLGHTLLNGAKLVKKLLGEKDH